jgi:hypothetical protein
MNSETWRQLQRRHMELRFTHREIAAAHQAIAALHGLQECVIIHVGWSEIPPQLVVRLAYVWTDDGKICFAAGEAPREITLRFEVVNELHMFNALTTPMLQEPHRINWGISEIAELVISSPKDSDDFGQAEFIWEGQRRMTVIFRAVTVTLSDSTPA